LPLPPPEPLQLRYEPIREEHIRGPATLSDRGTHAHPDPRRPIWREHVADIEADDFAQA
jgi:hypothetical protein